MPYERIIEITSDYLGPAAKRFVDRQISNLQKSPANLNKNDISMLALRIRSGLVVLTQDTCLVEEAFQRIKSVVENANQVTEIKKQI